MFSRISHRRGLKLARLTGGIFKMIMIRGFDVEDPRYKTEQT